MAVSMTTKDMSFFFFCFAVAQTYNNHSFLPLPIKFSCLCYYCQPRLPHFFYDPCFSSITFFLLIESGECVLEECFCQSLPHAIFPHTTVQRRVYTPSLCAI